MLRNMDIVIRKWHALLERNAYKNVVTQSGAGMSNPGSSRTTTLDVLLVAVLKHIN